MSYGWHPDYGRYEVGEELGENKEIVSHIVHYNTYDNNGSFVEHHRVTFKNLDAAIKELEYRREFWRKRCEIKEDAFFIEKRVTKKVISIKTEKLDC